MLVSLNGNPFWFGFVSHCVVPPVPLRAADNLANKQHTQPKQAKNIWRFQCLLSALMIFKTNERQQGWLILCCTLVQLSFD